MMTEKDMVSDVLSMTKASMEDYTRAIGGTSNQELRSTYQQLRAEAEKFHFDLGKIASQKGYYTTPQNASQQDRQQLKSQLSQGMNQGQGTNQGMRS
jgi:spore coat protein CotF